MSKKILAIIGGTYVYGAEKVSLDVLEGMAQHGHDVHCMVSGWNDGIFIAALKQLGIPYTPIKLGWYYVKKMLWSLDSLVHYPKAIIDFIKLYRNTKPEIIYTISFRQIILLYPFIQRNVIYHVHDPNSDSKQSKFFLKLVDKKILKYIAVSNFIKEDLIKSGISEAKISVVHNGVQAIHLPIQEVENDVLKLGIVGQIIPRKGHLLVFQAMKILYEQQIFPRLFIIGNGDKDFIALLKERAAVFGIDKQIIWLGFIENKKEIYKNIHILLAPTLTPEPFGLTAVEANMFGKPVIASNFGGLSEIILDGINGFSVNTLDITAIAKKIEYFLKYPNEIITMGKRGRQHVLENFSNDKMNFSVNKIINTIR